MDNNIKNIIEKAIKDFEVVEKEEIASYEEGYLGKKVYKVTLYDGSKRIVEQITKNKRNGDAVVIIPITKEGQFVVIIESRPNTKEGYSIAFPAGMVDEGEEQDKTASRELLEETGYQAINMQEIEEHYQDQGCSGAVIKTFLATDCEQIQSPKLDGSENLRTILLTYRDLLELLKFKKINDANSKIALMTYVLERRKKENDYE